MSPSSYGHHHLDKDLVELSELAYAFARDEVAPVIGDYYERAAFPYGIVSRLGELGLFGLPFPPEYGGMGRDQMAVALVLEQLARVDSSVAVTLEAAITLGATMVFRFGTDAQRSAWMPRLCSGETLAAFALTEPEGGSDVTRLRTRAELVAGEWVLNGHKAFITNSGTDLTGLAVVAAVTGTRPDGRPEISSILVPIPTPGLEVGAGYSKVGWCAADTHPLVLTDCRVPEENLLGPRGRGYAQCLAVLDEGRIGVAAVAVGLAQGCVDECLGYVKSRQAFGRPIGEFQAIQFKLADMATRAHVARVACYHAAARLVDGEPFKTEAAMAKVTASESAVQNARDATQIYAGWGFMNETPVARMWRDAKILEIGEGTNEVLRALIARDLGLDSL